MSPATDFPSASVSVDLGERSYVIDVGQQLLELEATFADLPRAHRCAIVTNDTVAALYADRLEAVLAGRYSRVVRIVLADGEAHKNWQTLQQIFDALLEARCDRDTVLFALGGGVIGDLTGFAAACYMRGIAYVQIPTTLLAQVDSSVGGKTGINHVAGKNMIGAFHQPRRVVVDLQTLATLPRRELVAGLAEVIKYGAVADDAFLSWIDTKLESLTALDGEALLHAVTRSCRIKADIVAADERETGVRAVLNFGHTFAHAIEAGAGYGVWLHGEAVGCGMAMAADLSVRAGLLDETLGRRLERIIRAAGLPVAAPRLGLDRYLDLMRGDKKSVGGELRFVLLDGPGRACVKPVRQTDLLATLKRFVG